MVTLCRISVFLLPITYIFIQMTRVPVAATPVPGRTMKQIKINHIRTAKRCRAESSEHKGRCREGNLCRKAKWEKGKETLKSKKSKKIEEPKEFPAFRHWLAMPQWWSLEMKRPTLRFLKTAPSIVKVGLDKQGDTSRYPRENLCPSAHCFSSSLGNLGTIWEA